MDSKKFGFRNFDYIIRFAIKNASEIKKWGHVTGGFSRKIDFTKFKLWRKIYPFRKSYQMMSKTNLKIFKMKFSKILNLMNPSEFHLNVNIVVFSLQTVFLLHITRTFIVILLLKLKLFHGGSPLLPSLELRSLWLTQELRLLWLTLTVQSDTKFTWAICLFEKLYSHVDNENLSYFCNKFMVIIN